MRPKEWRLWASLCGTHDLRNLSFVTWKIDQRNFPIFIKALVSANGITQGIWILSCIFRIIYASRDQKDWIQIKISYKIPCENANILFIPVTVSCCAIFEWCMYETIHLSEILTYQILIKILNQIAVCCTINSPEVAQEVWLAAELSSASAPELIVITSVFSGVRRLILSVGVWGVLYPLP